MPAEQLLLEVDCPIQPAPAKDRMRRRSGDRAPADRQIEFRLAAPEHVVGPSIAAPVAIAVPVPDVPASDSAIEEQPPFASWLLDQASGRGSLCALAKAGKLDRLFPRSGSADDVRARFSLAGADGDAFAALDDAEREYARSCQVPA